MYPSEGNGKLLKANDRSSYVNVQDVLLKNTCFSTEQLAPNTKPFYDFRFLDLCQITMLRTALWFVEVIGCVSA